uniref:(California timema) hypothetical protein n=1 Tax=Timema californicum TaxID=61474 RepID=A0A7R9P8D1_TIMCA|nr:unnamed protein product [Timema californicum]
MRGAKGKGNPPSPVHPTEIRTSISPSSVVELNTTSALVNYVTEAVKSLFVVGGASMYERGTDQSLVSGKPPSVHPTEIRTLISPSSAVELNTTSADTLLIKLTLEDFSHDSTAEDGEIEVRISVGKMRYLKSYLTLVLRVVLPIFVTAYYVWLRNQRSVVNGVRRQLFPAILAAITSSVTLTTLSGAVSSPCIKIDPLLRAIKRRPKTVRQECPSSPPSPEKSVTCDVLYEPVTSRVRADVIFIHGLHGSLVNTWRQGTWDAANVRTAPIARGPNSSPDDGYCEPPIDDTWVRDRNRSTDDSESDLQDYLLSDEEGVYDETKLATMMNDICRKSATAAEGPVGAEPYSPCWPRDWLPLDCPGVRVIALNYTTDPFLWRPFWVTKRIRTCLSERCREMMEYLKKLGVGQNPIVWVGHSKGGLFVKQMLIDAHQDESLGLYGLCSNTKSIMFYSVPHRGSSCADINLPLLRQSVELTEVQRECPEVLELHSKFLALIEESHLHAEIFSFIETVQTMMSFIYLQIVTIESAGIGKVELEEVNPHLRGGRVENLLGKKKTVHPTEIRTSISLSSADELNTTSALANYATEADECQQNPDKDSVICQPFKSSDIEQGTFVTVTFNNQSKNMNASSRNFIGVVQCVVDVNNKVKAMFMKRRTKDNTLYYVDENDTP